MAFQFHVVINKVKLPFKAKRTSICDNNERLIKGVARVNF